MITVRLRLHLLYCFSEQLQGEFQFSPRLFHTGQQLSVRLENRTIPFQRSLIIRINAISPTRWCQVQIYIVLFFREGFFICLNAAFRK